MKAKIKCHKILFFRSKKSVLAAACSATPNALPAAFSPSNYYVMLTIFAISCSFFCNCTNIAGHRTWKMIRKLVYLGITKSRLQPHAFLLLNHFLQHPPLLIASHCSHFL